MLETIKNDVFTIEGRLNRLKFLKYNIGLVAVVFLIAIILVLIGVIDESGAEDSIATYIIGIPMSIIQIMFQIRRLHDLNRSGWFVLLTAIPIVDLFLFVYLFCFKGTDGRNKYGYDPLLMED